MIGPLLFTGEITIAVLAIVLIAILFMQATASASGRRLGRWRAKEAGFVDLLNYAAVVDDGVVLGKNGAFSAAWIYEAGDNASSTDTERNVLSSRINQALANLGSGWMIHVDAVRRQAPSYSDRGASRYPDVLTAQIDEERRQLFEGKGAMYEGYFVLTATFFPPMLATQKFTELMFDDDREELTGAARSIQLVDQFKREIDALESRLSAGLKLTRLKGHRVESEDGTSVVEDDFLRWLNFCVTGLNHPVVLPSNPMYLDAVIGCQDVRTGAVLTIGQQYVQIVAIDGFPQESSPGILSDLTELHCEYRWSTRFIMMDAHEAVKHLEDFRKRWRQKIRGFFDQLFQTGNGRVDLDAVTMVADTDAAIAEVNSGAISQGYYTSCVLVMNESREAVEADVAKLMKALQQRGFPPRLEEANAMEAFMGSLPGHGVQNVRRPLLNTLNLADLMPVNTIWTGLNYAPCPFYPPQSPPLMECVTHGATPFRLNLHVRDVGHTLMLGPTGSGKSVHLALIAAQLRRYPGMSVFVFDKGLSMYALCQGVGGQHHVVAGDDERLAFCPLQFLASRSDRAWAAEWIDTLLGLSGVVTTPAQRNEITSAIANMASSGAKTISDFSITIQDEAIREALRDYTVDGAMGNLLDAETDSLSLSEFTVFEIEHLMNLGERYALPVLLYLFRRIQRALHGQPAAIILDEAWIMLGHEVFRAKIKEWLLTLRKSNCLVLMATQSLSAAVNSSIFDAIVESTSTKIFLPNINARNEDAAHMYARMGLNEKQVEIIASAIPKRQYYYVSEGGRRLYELALGPIALAFLAAGDKDSVAAIKLLEARYGEGWRDQWLARRSAPTPTLRAA
jgi:type IV secretion/conjugal transfer VirB4 family ATPase